MAKRKSLVSKLYQQYQKDKKARERAERQAAAQQARAHAQLMREHQAELRRQEREEQAQAQACERDAERAEREAAQRQLAREKERAQLTVVQAHDHAAEQTAQVRQRENDLAAVLVNRVRDFGSGPSEVERAYHHGGAAPATDVLEQLLNVAADLPAGLPGQARVELRPESRELRVDYELPRQDAVPQIIGYRYLPKAGEMRAEARKDAEKRKLYRDLTARLALRVLSEAFAATTVSLVDTVALNAHVSAKDRATGRPVRPCLISVLATRELMDSLVLDEPELDPVLCLGHLNAIVSPHPYDLESVRPVVTFDLSRYKFIDEIDIVAGLDSRPDLLELTPGEFEQLIRRLFEQIGMKAWITQSSRDEGIDAVAVNEDPVVGGLCVIQAKRYKNIVGIDAVQALSGAMNDKAATKGILVTTSWFGKASYDFVARNGRMDLIDGRNLKSMLQEHLGIDPLISLPKLPRGWQPHDLQ